jgi:hypothetical protein
LNVYVFFRLDVFLAVFFDAFAVFFDFFAFLAMFPSTQRKSNIRYACADYTIIAKFISRASKRVNGRHDVSSLQPREAFRLLVEHRVCGTEAKQMPCISDRPKGGVKVAAFSSETRSNR